MKQVENNQQVSYSLFKKPSYFIYLIICCIVIVAFVILITTMLSKRSKVINEDKIDINTGFLFGTSKQNCSLNKVYCFSDSDCSQQCADSYAGCVHGLCSTDVVASAAKNECDPSMGVIGFLIGNTALGIYEFICKSIDPAIAISVSENRMCFGDSGYKFDYLQSFPTIHTCNCNGKIIIPATSEKRVHAECDSRFEDLVPKYI